MIRLLPIALLALVSGAHAEKAASDQRIKIEVTDTGFTPNSINVKPGTNVILEVTRKTDETCSKEILIPSKNINQKLPLNETVTVKLGTLNKGKVRFGCGMSLMDSGVILVE